MPDAPTFKPTIPTYPKSTQRNSNQPNPFHMFRQKSKPRVGFREIKDFGNTDKFGMKVEPSPQLPHPERVRSAKKARASPTRWRLLRTDDAKDDDSAPLLASDDDTSSQLLDVPEPQDLFNVIDDIPQFDFRGLINKAASFEASSEAEDLIITSHNVGEILQLLQTQADANGQGIVRIQDRLEQFKSLQVARLDCLEKNFKESDQAKECQQKAALLETALSEKAALEKVLSDQAQEKAALESQVDSLVARLDSLEKEKSTLGKVLIKQEKKHAKERHNLEKQVEKLEDEVAGKWFWMCS